MGVACACVLLAAGPYRTQIYGFTPAGSDREFALEDRFIDLPSAAGALESAGTLATLPHYAGSTGDYKLALYVRDRLKEAGFDTSMETLTARVDIPNKLALELYPTGVQPGGPNAGKIPAYVPVGERAAYRKKMEAAPKPSPTPIGAPTPAPPVKIDLRETGDPADPDTMNPAVGLPFIAGSADGDVFAPLVYAGHGTPAEYALLEAHSIDPRGAVLLIRLGAESRSDLVRLATAHGAAGVLLYDDPAEDGAGRGATDPNGPWRPAYSVQRGSVGAGITIPVLPISASNARLLLAALKGPTAPRPWTGGMSVNYPFARGPAVVHLTVELLRKSTMLWNTIGILHGSLPGQALVVGAQRDAWVYGIGPGGGGTVTLLETARGLGYLAQTGWQPARSIVLAAWDGEELGSYGSLAYIKRHGEEIRDTSIAFLNTEPAITGPVFGADAVAAIASTIADASHVVPDPARPGNTIYDRYAFRTHGALPPVDRGRGGTDRAPFLFGSGTPAANVTFSGPFGPYHSSYDTLQFSRSIVDPQYDLHRAIAQLYGVAVLRLANADAVPYRFSAYVAPMNSALRVLTAFAAAHRVKLDSTGLDASIKRFAGSATHADTSTAHVTNAGGADRMMEAARVLDLSVYGVEGDTGISFPDIARAIRDGDQGAIDLAVSRARSTLDRAGTLIAQ